MQTHDNEDKINKNKKESQIFCERIEKNKKKKIKIKKKIK
jgi:hypothetical protein